MVYLPYSAIQKHHSKNSHDPSSFFSLVFRQESDYGGGISSTFTNSTVFGHNKMVHTKGGVLMCAWVGVYREVGWYGMMGDLHGVWFVDLFFWYNMDTFSHLVALKFYIVGWQKVAID